MFRRRAGAVEVLLAHPGGPFWARRDEASWTLPKGEIGPDEDPLAAARREFQEETGFTSTPPFLPLGELRQKSGKRITAWAFENIRSFATIHADCKAKRPTLVKTVTLQRIS